MQKIYILLINVLFIFNIYLYLINESVVKIKSLKQKYFMEKKL